MSDWWTRGPGGEVQGPYAAAVIDHALRTGAASPSTEVSRDRVLWAAAAVHPGFRAELTAGSGGTSQVALVAALGVGVIVTLAVVAAVATVLTARRPAAPVATVAAPTVRAPAAVEAEAPTPSPTPRPAGVDDWCTEEAIAEADVHRRGPFGERMAGVMGYLNLAAHLEVTHTPVGWSVLRGDAEYCAVNFRYRADRLTRVAEFTLVRLPALHLIPMNEVASQVTDMFDLYVMNTTDGASVAQRAGARIDKARAFRNARGPRLSLLDAYVDEPDHTSLVFELGACEDHPDPYDPAILRDIARAGFARTVCRDRTHDVLNELPTHHGRRP